MGFMVSKNPIVIGIAGGSGSGKTTMAKSILEKVGRHRMAFIQHDSYYHDLNHLPPAQRAQVNFDHPESLDSELMIKHILELRSWKHADIPIYDFTTDSRTAQTIRVNPQRVILVEGILIFAEPRLRELFDAKIFVDTDADIRFIRRLERDIYERGRTTESVIKQYMNTVRPMHLEFVEPSKRYADLIIPEGGFNEVAVDMIITRIEALLKPQD
jgi:uridine kinase